MGKKAIDHQERSSAIEGDPVFFPSLVGRAVEGCQALGVFDVKILSFDVELCEIHSPDIPGNSLDRIAEDDVELFSHGDEAGILLHSGIGIGDASEFENFCFGEEGEFIVEPNESDLIGGPCRGMADSEAHEQRVIPPDQRGVESGRAFGNDDFLRLQDKVVDSLFQIDEG